MGYSGVKCFIPIRVGFDELCRWVEWDKMVLGGFLPSGWHLMDCGGGLSGIKRC